MGGNEDALSGVVFYGSPGLGVFMSGITCRTSAGCLPGQVCCGTTSVTSSCMTGPCPQIGSLAFQLCGTAAECLAAGDTCGLPQLPLPQVGLMTCNAPADGGITGEGGVGEGGSSGDGDSGTDTGVSDAPIGG
jgi:hypothetical protein